MSHVGLFDLPAPLFDALDRVLSALLPDLARIVLYAALVAWASMALYARLSPQWRLRALRRRLAQAQTEMLDGDIEFGQLLHRSAFSLKLGMAQIWMTLWPSLLIALPLLTVLVWLSNRFDAQLPEAGSEVELCVQPASALAALPADLWVAPAPATRPGCRRLRWPAPQPTRLLTLGAAGPVALPWSQPIAQIHQRRWWNALVGNPLGYLPDGGAIDALRLGLPARPILNVGPAWVRGWLAPFLLVLTALSLWLRWRWKLV